MRGKFCTASTQICFPFFVDWIVSVYSAVELLSCLDHHLAVGKSGGSSVIQSPPILATEDRVPAQNPIRINCARWAGQVHYERIRFHHPSGWPQHFAVVRCLLHEQALCRFVEPQQGVGWPAAVINT